MGGLLKCEDNITDNKKKKKKGETKKILANKKITS